MEKPRHISPLIFLLVILVGSGYLLVHNGFFEGVFQTQILATVNSNDLLSPADIEASAAAATRLDGSHTASLR